MYQSLWIGSVNGGVDSVGGLVHVSLSGFGCFDRETTATV